MFKYSFLDLEKTWDMFSELWENAIIRSPEMINFQKEEEKFIVDFVKNHGDDTKILDLGCDSGRCLKVLEDNGFNKIYGIDISSKMLRNAKNKTNHAVLLHHDFRERLPFENESFDFVIIMGNTLNSGGLFESDIVLKQAHRVLKKEGFMIIGSYNAKFMTEDFVKDYYGKFSKEYKFKKFDKKNKTVYFGDKLHSHWLTENELKKMVEKSKFKLISIQKKGIGLIVICKRSD
jgi:ubiquinone/menaquinone biosynthesis C-methylase UbiE